MLGIENNLWLKIEGFSEIYPISDEDLGRSDDNKTSAVHFLRFQLGHEMIDGLKGGCQLSAGINHPEYKYTVNPIPQNISESLISDLD
jgi:hypothetical protein